MKNEAKISTKFSILKKATYLLEAFANELSFEKLS